MKTTSSKWGGCLQAGAGICFSCMLESSTSPFPSSPVRDDTITLMLLVSQIRLLKCNTELMVKFQSAKHSCETGAALLGVQKGFRANARREYGQSHKPSVRLLHTCVKT